jgi:hypothetical protein
MITRFRCLRPILIILILGLFIGCAAVTLREAQDHFNRGAEIELRAMDRSLLSDHPEASPGDAIAALNEYRLANSATTKLIDEESRKLKQDNLLGATYVLKAMALWRISDLEGDILTEGESPRATQPLDKVTNSRQELLAVLSEIEKLRQGEDQLTLGTRDRVLHKALYGFYDHDGGRSENDYTKAREWFKSANQRLKDALTGDVPQRHPIRVYVGSAQLRTLAAWNQALYSARKNCDCRSTPKPQCCDQIVQDQQTINDETKNVVCELRPFWDGKKEVRDSLSQLLSTIGLPSVFSQCR